MGKGRSNICNQGGDRSSVKAGVVVGLSRSCSYWTANSYLQWPSRLTDREIHYQPLGNFPTIIPTNGSGPEFRYTGSNGKDLV